jgi:hypothetical protein
MTPPLRLYEFCIVPPGKFFKKPQTFRKKKESGEFAMGPLVEAKSGLILNKGAEPALTGRNKQELP